MADTFDKEKRSAIMRAVKSTNTSPEMKVRKAIHAAGFRYRLHHAGLPGKPDLVFARRKIVVFVHGCFWHWHGCKRSRMPASNRKYWERKIQRNVERDQTIRERLEKQGWTVLVVWECMLEDGIKHAIRILNSRTK